MFSFVKDNTLNTTLCVAALVHFDLGAHRNFIQYIIEWLNKVVKLWERWNVFHRWGHQCFFFFFLNKTRGKDF